MVEETTFVAISGHNKKGLVELITQKKSEGFLGWVELANHSSKGPVAIKPRHMAAVHAEVLKFEQNRKDYDKQSYEYYRRAIDAIKEAYGRKDYKGFKEGCEDLLGLIGQD